MSYTREYINGVDVLVLVYFHCDDVLIAMFSVHEIRLLFLLEKNLVSIVLYYGLYFLL